MSRTVRYFLLISFFLLIPISLARADELLDIQKEIDKKNQEYSSTQSTLDSIKKQISSLSSQAYATKPAVDEANKKVEDIRRQLAGVEAALNSKKDEASVAVAIRDQQVRNLYMHPVFSNLPRLR